MKTPKLSSSGAALLMAAMVALVGSHSWGAEEADVIETPDGAIIVDTLTLEATVTAIDKEKRKVTLENARGHKTVYKVGPAAINFDQIKVGDKVKATVTEEAAIYLGSGAPPSADAAAAVALAPKGAKPGGVMVNTAQITAKITEVDAKKHKVTLELPNGATKKIKVGKKVNLSSVKPGDNITVQLSEGLALTVQKP